MREKEIKDIELEKVNGGTNADVREKLGAHNVGAYLGMITSPSEQCPKPDAPIVGCFIALPGFP